MQAAPSVLLVEDHGVTRHTVSKALSEAGFEVHEAKDGVSAIALMMRHRPQLVIQDLALPDVDSWALTSSLRALAGDAPLHVIACSDLATDMDARRIGELGFDDVIAKPILPSRLVELVRAQCEVDAQLSALRVLQTLSDPLARAEAGKPIASNNQERGHEGELLRRCSALSAELMITRALSQALLQAGDVEGALVSALSNCLDACQSDCGALYLLERNEQLRTCALGSQLQPQLRALPNFFGHEGWLRAIMRTGAPVTLAEASAEVRGALEQAGVKHALVVPLMREARALGALFMAAPRDALGCELSFQRFAGGIAAQVAQGLAMVETCRAHAHAEREAEQQRRLARDQAAMWRALVDGAPDVVMHLDVRGRVRFINRMPAGSNHASAQALSWFDLFEPEYHEEMARALAAVFSDGASHTLEISQRGSDQAQIWTESHLGPVRNGSEITGALIIQRDVSEKKQAEAQLIVADRMVSVGSLAAAIAHEINNPLAAVSANLELALRDAEELGTRAPGELLDELVDASEAAARVRDIVRDLQVFSRASDDSMGPLEIDRVLDSALRMAWNEVRQRATLQRDFQPTPRVFGNASRLGQALLALILHSAHGIEEGAVEQNTISVQLFTDVDGKVVMTLRDSGPTLSSTAQARLLKPFSSSRPPGASDILGLSICQRVLDEHGGTITFENHGAAGNLLRVSLPACELPQLEHHEEPSSVVRALRRGRVLVIDDERLIIQMLRRTLAREHEVVTLDNAADALRKLEAGERYDAIVCDLMMPGMSGMEFHRRVASDFPDLAERIVFFTGGAFTPRAREFLKSVSNHRVEKPVRASELRALINTMVR